MFWIKKFLFKVKKYLKPPTNKLVGGGKIFMEFDPLQKEKIKEILEKQSFKFQFKKDQFKKYRWLKVIKNN